MRDRLIELIVNADTYDSYECKLCTKKDTSCTHCNAEKLADHLLANGVIVPVRCKDCIHAVELDKHCDISRTAYRHCSLLRGDETKYVWHKYKKYYKDYSIVYLDGYCDSGELKEREKV